MIVTLAQEVRSRLVTVDQLEVTRNEISNIEATREELEKVAQDVLVLTTTFSALRPRIAAPVAETVRNQCERIAADLERSLARFASERRQVSDLKQIQRRLQEARSSLAQGWSTYATSVVRPSRELLQLVGGLPEIAAQRGTIDQLIAQLDSQAQAAPRSEVELTRFDERVRDLEGRLAALKQLDPEIKAFLTKVRTHEATIEDLSPAVLRWCREGSHASSFVISFR